MEYGKRGIMVLEVGSMASSDSRAFAFQSSDQRGATMVEYSLIAALISVFCIATISMVGQGTSNTFSDIKNHLGEQNLPPVPDPE